MSHSFVPQSPLVKDGQTIVFLGDSITRDPEGYVGLITRSLQDSGIRVINAGVGGDKANQMLARFDQDVLIHQPDWIAINVGINDVWHGFYDFNRRTPRNRFNSKAGLPLAQYRRCLEEMVRKAKAAGANVLLLAPTIIGEAVSTRDNQLLGEYVRCMEAIAREYGTRYCPLHHLFLAALKDSPALTTDGVHMNQQGANLMATAVLEHLGLQPTPTSN